MYKYLTEVVEKQNMLYTNFVIHIIILFTYNNLNLTIILILPIKNV